MLAHVINIICVIIIVSGNVDLLDVGNQLPDISEEESQYQVKNIDGSGIKIQEHDHTQDALIVQLLNNEDLPKENKWQLVKENLGWISKGQTDFDVEWKRGENIEKQDTDNGQQREVSGQQPLSRTETKNGFGNTERNKRDADNAKPDVASKWAAVGQKWDENRKKWEEYGKKWDEYGAKWNAETKPTKTRSKRQIDNSNPDGASIWGEVAKKWDGIGKKWEEYGKKWAEYGAKWNAETKPTKTRSKRQIDNSNPDGASIWGEVAKKWDGIGKKWEEYGKKWDEYGAKWNAETKPTKTRSKRQIYNSNPDGASIWGEVAKKWDGIGKKWEEYGKKWDEYGAKWNAETKPTKTRSKRQIDNSNPDGASIWGEVAKKWDGIGKKWEQYGKKWDEYGAKWNAETNLFKPRTKRQTDNSNPDVRATWGEVAKKWDDVGKKWEEHGKKWEKYIAKRNALKRPL